jgi:hypothetical protein
MPGRVAILVVGVLIVILLLQFIGVDSGMPRLPDRSGTPAEPAIDEAAQ